MLVDHPVAGVGSSNPAGSGWSSVVRSRIQTTQLNVPDPTVNSPANGIAGPNDMIVAPLNPQHSVRSVGGNANVASERLVDGHTGHRVKMVSPDAPRIARILIVARPALSRALSSTLAAAGYEVHRTPDPASAVEAARRLRPQLAIVAKEVPGSCGMTVAHLLHDSQSSLPVILLGAASGESGSSAIVALPADVSPAALLSEIAQQIPHQSEDNDPNAG
jgi:PleD family two-component response regulator